ncbi:Crp/Fnr family transcriptional regulator [Mangrovimonas cancribranchiae]|uniref:Crp/Fnr family transcriptional regulator n=1 Tax=Mangrovimonas cancribranchiae TaxID=3080055 RepID=A0AAU6P9Z7_9FLAO
METFLENYKNIFESDLIDEMAQVGIFKKVAKGQLVLDVGEYIKYMPLIVSGAIKVMREDEEGEELLLYFLEVGDTCAMTISCCLGQKKSEITAIAETDSSLVMIPVKYMSIWMSKYQSWQNFILESYNERISELLEAVDTIAFLKMDERIYKYLKDKAMVNRNDLVEVTHQQIANDLHTSRVVVSRLLKSLEKQNIIELQRNCIKVLKL